MGTQSRRGRIENALSLALFVASIGILIALWAGNTFGASFPLLVDLKSKLAADYSPDIFGGTLKAIELTILEEIEGDHPAFANAGSAYSLAMQNPVPTATPYGVQGEGHPSGSPTEILSTSEPTNTQEPSKAPPQEPTPTPETTEPTSPPSPTSTPVPTEKPKTTPEQEDVHAPVLSAGKLTPSPGGVAGCQVTISITDLGVKDRPWSSGIEWVKLKYLVEGYSDYLYSSPLKLNSGGRTSEGGWKGCYQGEVEISIDPEWESPSSGEFEISLWAKARDQAGLEGYLLLGTYTMPASCGEDPD